MKTYPLESISLDKAMEFQFKMVDAITKEFSGREILNRGDLGVVPTLNKPITTYKVEKVIASFFDEEMAIMVRGSGTGAIRYALFACIKANEKLLVHTAPIYSTTTTTIEMLGLKIIRANFNDLEDIKKVIRENEDIKAALVQYTRQAPEDSYDIEEVIKTIKSEKDIPIVTDDNYAVMKVNKIGTQCGADMSCFSTFKLGGPEGIGVIVGKKKYLDIIYSHHYSGGSQTQGWEALDVLHGLVYAPVSLAIQARVNDELVERLNNNEIKEVSNAFLANAQSKVLLVEFKENIAKNVLIEAEKLGALLNPVGAESKYEISPLFYRVSGTFKANNPDIVNRMIRINPNRAGAETIINILKESIKRVKSCS